MPAQLRVKKKKGPISEEKVSGNWPGGPLGRLPTPKARPRERVPLSGLKRPNKINKKGKKKKEQRVIPKVEAKKVH